ncbi:alkane-1-monooxygenase [Chloropicon primus]|nr:alkane-1-monooxygenase [Chloropicon primus]
MTYANLQCLGAREAAWAWRRGHHAASRASRPEGRRSSSRGGRAKEVGRGITTRTRTGTGALSSPWEQNEPGELSGLGKWYKRNVVGSLRFLPMIAIQLAFIPFLFSFVGIPLLESVGIRLPSMLALATKWVWSKVGLAWMSPDLGTAVKGSVTRVLELPVNSPNELVWKTILGTVLPLMPVVYFFVVLPVIDFVIGREGNEQARASGPSGTDHKEHRMVIWASGFIYMCLLPTACYAAAVLPLLSVLTIGVGFGLYGATMFAVSHELLHSPIKSDRVLSRCLLACVFYPHYEHSHKYIHHKLVGTPEDPSTARRGEHFYAFFVRSVVDNVKMLMRTEAASMKLSWIARVAFIAGSLLIAFGPRGLAVYLIQAFIGILSLELVNYIEHYGLKRKRLANGKYEQVSRSHSWNADWFATNCHIVNLQLHSDHHLNSMKPYQNLKNFKDGPQLPGPYSVMMLLSLCPPLFFRVMDPRLDEVEASTKEG